jgi:hypothetical protein
MIGRISEQDTAKKVRLRGISKMLTHCDSAPEPAVASFPACVLVSCAKTFAAPSLPIVAPAAARPNIVVVMTDDQTVESLWVMRKTRALISRRGTMFNNSFLSFPLCCPARATFLLGEYPQNHGVLSNNAPRSGYDALNYSNTLPLWLREAGYYTPTSASILMNTVREIRPRYRWIGTTGSA